MYVLCARAFWLINIAAKYLQFRRVQRDVPRDFLQPSRRTIDRCALAMACRRTFRVDAALAGESRAILVRT